MLGKKTIYCFDFDGTVSTVEALPRLAKAAGIEEEMKILTDLTVKGHLPFSDSFRLRIKLLSGIPLNHAQEIMDQVPISESILNFISSRRDQCIIVTGNLDVYMEPIRKKIPCRFFTSEACMENGILKGIDRILDKGDVLRLLRDQEGHQRIVAIGDGANDTPMFEAADVAISYFGVTAANRLLYPFSHYIVFKEHSLCQLLKTL